MVIQDSLSTNVSMMARGGVFVISSIIIMLWISWRLSLVTLTAMIPIVIVMVGYSQRMRKLQAEIQQEKSKMTVVAEEAFSNVRTVKAFANEDEEVAKFFKGN